MATRKRMRARTRSPNIYSHYAPPAQEHRSSNKPASRNGPMILVVGFIIFVGFVLASITYANLSQRSGGGIFGIAASKSGDSLHSLTTNACSGNDNRQELIVSISKQRMWACSYSVAVHDAPVVTGMTQYAADITPVNTYRIESKQQNIPLVGSDSNGGWQVHVDYWMQFLVNKYGNYGFHDATWRKPSEFGHVDVNAPFSVNPHGSRGCVEAPLADMKWIYDWTPVGTTVIVRA